MLNILYNTLKGQNDYNILKRGRYITSSGNWTNGDNYVYALIPINSGDAINIKANSNVCIYAFLKSDYSGTATVSFADGVSGRATIAAGNTIITSAPATSKYLYVLVNNSTTTNKWLYWPEKILINGENVSWPIRWKMQENNDLALAALHNVNGGNGIPYLHDSFTVASNGTWMGGNYKYALFPITAGDIITIIAKTGDFSCFYAFLEHDVIPGENKVAFAGNETSRRTLNPGEMISVSAPVGSVFLYILYSVNNDIYYP